MVTNFELEIMELLQKLRESTPYPARIIVARNLAGLIVQNRGQIEYLKRTNNDFYNQMKKTLKLFIAELKDIMVRRKKLFAEMWGIELMNKKLDAFENRALSSGEISRIEQIRQQEAERLQEVSMEDFADHTNMLIRAKKQLEIFVKQL